MFVTQSFACFPFVSKEQHKSKPFQKALKLELLIQSKDQRRKLEAHRTESSDGNILLCGVTYLQADLVVLPHPLAERSSLGPVSKGIWGHQGRV